MPPRGDFVPRPKRARLIGVLLDRVEPDGRILMPGYTHLQRGQPILLGHQILSRTWALHRDHVQEVAAACAICCGHLSRMAEELVLWSSAEFRFVRLGDAYATGSRSPSRRDRPGPSDRSRSRPPSCRPGALP